MRRPVSLCNLLNGTVKTMSMLIALNTDRFRPLRVERRPLYFSVLRLISDGVVVCLCPEKIHAEINSFMMGGGGGGGGGEEGGWELLFYDGEVACL